jgi:RNA 2',3'-cyclic 3'-phosphodiesterase
MRLFTGIGIPYKVRRNLELLLAHLKPTAHIKWSPADNFHITTKFIGEWPEERVEELKAALRGVPRPSAFAISISGLGWFPNPHSPRIFWCGIQGGDALAALARNTEEALSEIGISKEDRPFSPHLTLARIQSPENLFPLKQAVAQLPSVDFGRFTPESYHLYLSKPGPHGSVYSVLDSYPIGNE